MLRRMKRILRHDLSDFIRFFLDRISLDTGRIIENLEHVRNKKGGTLEMIDN